MTCAGATARAIAATNRRSGRRCTWLLSSTAMPWSRSRWLLRSLLDTAPAMRSLMPASASMKWLTVEPVPTPTTLPGGT